MKSRLVSILLSGGPVAGPALLFLSVILIALFQVPSHAFMRAGMTSAAVAVNEVVAIGGVPLVIIWLARLDGGRLLPLKPLSARALFVVAAATLGADILIDYLTFASELLIPASAHIEGAYRDLMAVSGAGDFFVKVLVLCLLPAVFEEIYFRGFCLTSIAARVGGPAAIAISALLFAMLHGNVWYVHLYFLLGILLGWIYWSTGSLLAAMLCHCINNLWTFVGRTAGLEIPLPFGSWVADALLASVALAAFALSAFFIRRFSSSEASSSPSRRRRRPR